MTYEILKNTLYFLALVNPVSKISVLSVFASDEDRREMTGVVVRSSGVALAILLVLVFAGEFILRDVFHVEQYSLRVSGGVVLFFVGYKALSKGVFFEVDTKNRFRDLSIVPLACPMIAGPATIAAAVSSTAENGALITSAALFASITINMVVMLFAPLIGDLLKRFNLLGALIRITGLIVVTIAVQMVLSGVGAWLGQLP